MAANERLDAADHAAVGRLLREAHAGYAERMGPVEWGRLSGGLAQAARRRLLLFTRQIGRGHLSPSLGVAAPAGRGADGTRTRPLAAAHRMVHRPCPSRSMGFVVDDDLPTNFGLRYWRYRLNLSEEE